MGEWQKGYLEAKNRMIIRNFVYINSYIFVVIVLYCVWTC